MLRLLSIELHKLRYNRSAKVISIVYFVLITFIALISSLEYNIGPVKISAVDQGIFNFPYIWHFNTYIAAILKIFLAIVIVSLMANEYSYSTLKQNLIDGLSKKEFILSKFFIVIGFSSISTLFVFIVSMILGLIFSDFNEVSIIFSDMEYLLAYFIKLVGFFSFCLFLGILVKRSAFALGFLIIWYFFEKIVYFFVLKLIFFRGTDIPDKVIAYFPLESMSSLIVEPFSRLNAIKTAASQLGEGFQKSYEVPVSATLIVIGWTVVFIWLSYVIVKKRDL